MAANSYTNRVAHTGKFWQIITPTGGGNIGE